MSRCHSPGPSATEAAVIIEQQLHGYRQGHELLSGTIRLPPRDQDLVDRLSDLAGPLAPGEKFAPYLTCYPLPSGTHYVLARTWQDREAPRAGCVRTRSLIIPMVEWMSDVDPWTLSAVVTDVGPTAPCKRLSVEAPKGRPLPPVDGAGIELLEALFLEDSPAVAVFGASSPDLIALRILTAIWPSMRRRYTISTFCNSPRTIAKKSFDLVFAPIDARPNFSDWKGRRIDGSRSGSARHPWASRIVEAVFRAPHPSLSELDVFGEMAGDEEGSVQSLRLSMLWEELSGKVDVEPHAALGLLDIANTRSSRRADLVAGLTPAFARAAQAAVANFPPAEAWRFLQVLISKLGNTRWRLSLARSIRSLTASFAAQHPRDAVVAIPSLLEEEGGDFLLSGIAQGLSDAVPFEPVAHMLAELAGRNLLRTVLAAPELIPMTLGVESGIEQPLLHSMADASADERSQAHRRMLPHLVVDKHADLLSDCLSEPTAQQVVSEVEHLLQANGLQQPMLNGVIVQVARRVGASRDILDVVVRAKNSDIVYTMLKDLIQPTPTDVDWILDTFKDADPRRATLLIDTLQEASRDELQSIFGRAGHLRRVTAVIRSDARSTELLARIAESVPMPAGDLLPLVIEILPDLAGRRGSVLAAKCLYEALVQGSDPSYDKQLATLIDRTGTEVDAQRAIRVGIAADLATPIVSRNLVLFDAAAPVTRKRFINEPEALTDMVMARRTLDITYQAAEAASRMLWDSASVNKRGYVRASARLLPYVMEQHGPSASALLVAVFPPVYRELQQESLPEFLSFVFMFLDWDRCKIARRGLAQAALHSRWRPRDVAFAAARAGDAERILRTIAKRDGGMSFLTSVSNDITSIPEPAKKQVWRAIKEIRSDSSLRGKLPFDV